jgi:DNA modification methylase
MKDNVKLMLGNNLDSLKELPNNFVDSIVTDPPYGLSFMNKKWDYDVPSVEFWTEVYRVLKPGGHILSFGGTRTYHRMVVNIEDAGFEIRDQIQWIYGSGFPKSLNIGKGVDKKLGNEREVVGENPNHRGNSQFNNEYTKNLGQDKTLTKGQSEYEGWGTGLKPANEPIVLARKPLSEKTVVDNVLKYGTGGINIDGCRIEGIDPANAKRLGKSYKTDESNLGNSLNISNEKYRDNITVKVGGNLEGRFPANVILECTCDEVIKGETIDKRRLMGSANNGNDEGRYNWNNGDKNDFKSVRGHLDTNEIHTDPNCPCRIMDEQSGELKSGNIKPHTQKNKTWKFSCDEVTSSFTGDKGGASRFFYQAKVSKKERNMGLNGFEDKETETTSMMWDSTTNGKTEISYERKVPVNKNNHPTLKPVQLMTYLCRLVTPPNGIVLDPFMGSGSTGISALLEGFQFIGMEMDEEYFNIAQARINSYEQYTEFIKK